jgi:hypothetical protein
MIFKHYISISTDYINQLSIPEDLASLVRLAGSGLLPELRCNKMLLSAYLLLTISSSIMH